MQRRLIKVVLIVLCMFATKASYAQKTTYPSTQNPAVLIQQYQMACQQGDYATAIKKFNTLLAIAEKFPNLDIGEYANTIAQHLNLLLSINEIEQARNLLQHANDFASEKLIHSPNDNRHIEYLYGLFSIYTFDMEGALEHYSTAKQLYNNAGDNSPQYYAFVLNPLFNVYAALQDYAFAKLIADELREYFLAGEFEDYLKSQGIDYDPTSEGAQQVLSIPSMRYAQLGYFDEALEMLEPIIKQTGTDQIGAFADDIRNLYAGLLLFKHDWSKAKEIYRKSLWYGTSPLAIKQALVGLVVCCAVDSSNETLYYLSQLNEKIQQESMKVMPEMTPMERQTYWENVMGLPRINYAVLNVFQNRGSASALAYDVALYSKSMQDKETHKTATWNGVKKSLSKKEVAVEFVLCPSDMMVNNPRVRIGALVLRKNSKVPTYIDLCDWENVDVFRNAHADIALVNQCYAMDDTMLYHHIWQKITPLLKDGDVIYYSTTGALIYLNLEVVSDGQRRMNQRFKLHQVSSTAAIGEVKAAKWQKKGDAVVYGGLVYDESVEEMQAAAKAYQQLPDKEMLALRSLYQDTPDSRGAINTLSGTLEEAKFIRDILVKNGSKVALYTEELGNEESVKALSGHAPYILHIATHGFFLTTPNDEYQHRSVVERLDVMGNRQHSFMLYTGLMMSGAFNAWMGRELIPGIEDGILTSYELSQIDLSGCRLAVLSACETGRGVPNGYAGDLGLRHALKLAGVQTVIASLWEVPDDATSILMKSLYENISAGIEPSQALIKAQDAVKEKFPQPYYWAGFHLID